jgi:hypothetical protein
LTHLGIFRGGQAMRIKFVIAALILAVMTTVSNAAEGPE